MHFFNFKEMQEKPLYYPTIAQSFLLIGCLILTILLFSVLQASFLINLVFSIQFIFDYIVPMMIVIWIGIRLRRKNGDKSLNIFTGAPTSIFLLSVPVIIVLSMLIDPLMEWINMSPSMKKIFEDAFKPTLINNFMAVVAAPILEELLFRGVILDGLLKNYDPRKAIVISALLFGLIHMNPWQFIDAFTGGLVMGWLYWKTGSLLLCMWMHFMNNIISTVLVYATGQVTFSLLKTIGPAAYIVVYFFSLVVFIVSIRAIKSALRKRKELLLRHSAS